MLERILAAWRLSPDLHRFASPADETTIAAAEGPLGRRLPDTLKVLYQFSDGMSSLGGNLFLEPLVSHGPATTLCSLTLRATHLMPSAYPRDYD